MQSAAAQVFFDSFFNFQKVVADLVFRNLVFLVIEPFAGFKVVSESGPALQRRLKMAVRLRLNRIKMNGSHRFRRYFNVRLPLSLQGLC